MKVSSSLTIFMTGILIYSCAPLKEPVITKNDNIENYKYFFIFPTGNLTSGSGTTYGKQYYTSSKTVNPSDVVSGLLLKEGFIRLPELNPELSAETLIINYGESGKRNRGLGYTIEVTLQFIVAKSHKPICSCTAEGQGETEADDIRQAITRCLNSLLSKGK